MTTSFPVSFFWRGVGGSCACYSPTRDSLMLLFLPLWRWQWQRSLEPHRAALTNSSQLNSAQLCSDHFALFTSPSFRYAFSVPSGWSDSNSMNAAQLRIHYFCTSTPQMDYEWPGGCLFALPKGWLTGIWLPFEAHACRTETNAVCFRAGQRFIIYHLVKKIKQHLCVYIYVGEIHGLRVIPLTLETPYIPLHTRRGRHVTCRGCRVGGKPLWCLCHDPHTETVIKSACVATLTRTNMMPSVSLAALQTTYPLSSLTLPSSAISFVFGEMRCSRPREKVCVRACARVLCVYVCSFFSSILHFLFSL